MRHGRLAVYERPGRFERRFGSYELALGALPDAYDLGVGNRTLEVKQALVALATRLAAVGSIWVGYTKPGNWLPVPATISETTWRSIDLANGWWDGPTADEFVAFVSRYQKMGLPPLSGPFIQYDPVLMAPQPTAHGLELLAGAVAEELGGREAAQRLMPEYMAWRDKWFGGEYTPPSVISGPTQATPVGPNTDAVWARTTNCPLPHGSPRIIQIEQQKHDAWDRLLAATLEPWRWQELVVLQSLRQQEIDEIAAHGCGANAGPVYPYAKEEAACWARPGYRWDQVTNVCRSTAEFDCVNNLNKWDAATKTCIIPSTTKPGAVVSSDGSSIVPVVVIAALATLGVRWALTRRTR